MKNQWDIRFFHLAKDEDRLWSWCDKGPVNGGGLETRLDEWNRLRVHVIRRVTCRECLENIVLFGDEAVTRLLDLDARSAKSRSPMCDEPTTKEQFYVWYRNCHNVLHEEWSAAVGTPDYDKKIWIQRENDFLDEARLKADGLKVKPPYLP